MVADPEAVTPLLFLTCVWRLLTAFPPCCAPAAPLALHPGNQSLSRAPAKFPVDTGGIYAANKARHAFSGMGLCGTQSMAWKMIQPVALARSVLCPRCMMAALAEGGSCSWVLQQLLLLVGLQAHLKMFNVLIPALRP